MSDSHASENSVSVFLRSSWYSVLFWKYLLTAAIIAKLFSWNDLTFLGRIECSLLIVFLMVVSFQLHKSWARFSILGVVLVFGGWNLFTMLTAFGAGEDCGCFGNTPASKKVVLLIELVSIPFLFASCFLRPSFFSDRFYRRSALASGMFTIVLGFTFVFAGNSSNTFDIGNAKLSDPAKVITESELLPRLKNLQSDKWCVVYVSTSCSKCAWIVNVLSRRVGDDWNILLADTSLESDRDQFAASFSADSDRNFLVHLDELEIPDNLPLVCTIINGNPVAIEETSLKDIWEESVEESIAIFAENESATTDSNLMSRWTFESR